MAYNNYQQFPFWDFVRSFDQQNGVGVDHTAEGDRFGGPGHHHGPPPGGFAFGGPPFWGRGGWGHGPSGWRGGRRGRHGHRRDGSHEGRGSRGPSPDGGEHPEGEQREGSPNGRRGPRSGRRGGYHGHRGGMGGHGRRGPHPFGGQGGPGGFDMNALMAALSAHPLAEALGETFRNYTQQAGFNTAGAQSSGDAFAPEDTDSEDNFIPPVDVFSTEKSYVLHVALPGAKKEDVGINWDEEKSVLNIAGVVYRQGDEAFLQTLAQSERKVGVFERVIKLPPGMEEKEEVDGDNISAKLEDGVLIITVPKVERGWTEVKKVDIQ